MKPDDPYPTLSALLDEIERSPLGGITLKDLIMEIRIRIHEKKASKPLLVDVLPGETEEFDIAVLNGFDLDVLDIGTPAVGTLTINGTVATYTAPAASPEREMVVPYTTKQKLPPPRAAAA